MIDKNNLAVHAQVSGTSDPNIQSQFLNTLLISKTGKALSLTVQAF